VRRRCFARNRQPLHGARAASNWNSDQSRNRLPPTQQAQADQNAAGDIASLDGSLKHRISRPRTREETVLNRSSQQSQQPVNHRHRMTPSASATATSPRTEAVVGGAQQEQRSKYAPRHKLTFQRGQSPRRQTECLWAPATAKGSDIRRRGGQTGPGSPLLSQEHLTRSHMLFKLGAVAGRRRALRHHLARSHGTSSTPPGNQLPGLLPADMFCTAGHY